jgi:hypothetical protein
MTRPLLVLLLAAALTGCGGGEPEPERRALTTEQACDQAEQVTDAYRDSLQSAGDAQEARAVIDRTVSGLRDIDAPSPVAPRVDALADALAGLLTAVEAGAPAAELQPKAAAVGTSTAALAQACGRAGGSS